MSSSGRGCSRPRFRARVLLAAALLVPSTVALGQARPQPDDQSIREKSIEKLVAHYADLYGHYLASRDWIARAMAVLGLGRIDAPLTSRKLVEVMTGDEKPVVRVFAWEALHARLESLTEKQEEVWATTGRDLTLQNHLRGDLRTGLLKYVGPEGPTEENRKLFLHVFKTTNALVPADIRTLETLRDLLAGWADVALARALVEAMGDHDRAYRAEFLLRGLDDTVPEARTHVNLGSTRMWQKTRTEWVQQLREWRRRPPRTRVLPPYFGDDHILPKAETITDPADPIWRKDLELPRFKLDHLDVSLAVDSTGSMGSVIDWVKRDVAKMMRALALLSYEPRIGITLYRDRGDAYVVQTSPLTDRVDLLTRAIADARAHGGGDRPEAVYEALRAVITKQRWSSGHYARWVVVLVGDAPPHAETMDKLKTLVTRAAEKGYRFFCVKCGVAQRGLPEFDQIARWGKGRSLAADFSNRVGPGRRVVRDPRTGRPVLIPLPQVEIAKAADADGPYRRVIREVVQVAMPEAYLDRLDPFMSVFLQYAEEPTEEERAPFGPPRRP